MPAATTNRPDSKGIIRADFSNFLQSLLRAKDETTFTQANFRDDNLSASYQIQYAESLDDGTSDGYVSPYIPVIDPYYVIYAAKQPQSSKTLYPTGKTRTVLKK